MRILITGGLGFIGSHLGDALSAQGNEVINYDLKNGNDILDLKNLKEKAKGVSGIIHFAAMQRVISGFRKPFEAIEHNIMGLSNVLQVAQENNAWVLFGSSKTVYGQPKKLPVKEEDEKNPTNIYSLTKLVSEHILRDFCKNYGLRAAVVRFSTIFGSERDLLDRAIPTFMYKSINNIDLIVEDPERTLDPVFIDDLIPALTNIVGLLAKSEKGFFDDFNAVSSQPIKISEIVNAILKVASSRANIIGTKPPRSYDFGAYAGDNSKIQKLGFRATPLEPALKIYHQRMQAALAAGKYSKEEIDDMLRYYEK
ncbi:MAG: NAD(P)-dependent oxidoreductase [DPANN group archaeon]|nr:NAD(P)-dependent oxidoreductase [DPANN group archaeon]